MIKDSEVQQVTPEDFSRTMVSLKKKKKRLGVGGGRKEEKENGKLLKHKGEGVSTSLYFCLFLKTDMTTGKQNFLGEERK